MSMLSLSVKSILSRRYTVMLTIFSIALSMMLLLAVERLRVAAQESFANTISGTDLIVGARSGPTQLLLYSVFRMGDATNNISRESFEYITSNKDVAWVVPIALGDSHHGFRVLGTDANYFEYYRYAHAKKLALIQGKIFADKYEAVIGADVAQELKYQLGKEIILAHGMGEVSFAEHADKPFRVVGILEKTGTPVDRTVHVTMQGMDAMHEGWKTSDSGAVRQIHHDDAHHDVDSVSEKITAILIGTKSKLAIFRLQREINEYASEPLLAIMPGATLQGLWDTMSIAQNVLRAISVLVMLVGISGMVAVMLSGLNERRREMAILRSVGARPVHIFTLFIGESFTIMLLAATLGVTGLYVLQWVVQPIVQTQLGLYMPIQMLSWYEIFLLGSAVNAGIVAGMIPAWRAYRYSLVDGMMIRI